MKTEILEKWLRCQKYSVVLMTSSYLYKEKLFPFISYDGVNTHLGISYILQERYNIGLIYLEQRYFGLAAGLRLNTNN